MDICDRALLEQERELDAIIKAARQAAVHAEASAESCQECGDEIPRQRRQAVPGCQLCVHCQDDQESHARRGTR